jgi:CubicO group peptidase (beta-lactamase class C family)
MRLLIPSITQICKDEGVAGVSVGVIHNGDNIWTEGLGFRDQAKTTFPDADTVYEIGNITMSMVAAGIGKLVEEGKFDWTTSLADILPELKALNSHLAYQVTIADLLSHRSGLDGNAELRLASHGDGEVLLSLDLLLKTVETMPFSAALRPEWSLCPWGYSIAAHIISSVSQQPLHEYLKDQLFQPLGMDSTGLRPPSDEYKNVADPHASLANGEIHSLNPRSRMEGTFLEGACGAYSSVNDLLKWAQATITASTSAAPSTTLKQIPHILSNQIAMAAPSLLERSYGFGWARAQLPGVVGLLGTNKTIWDISEQPVLGAGSTSRLMIYHQSGETGHSSFIAIFPETQSAVVVLTNTTSVSDAGDWIARTLIEGLFNHSNPVDHALLAEQARKRKLEQFQTLHETLCSQRKQGTNPLPRECYIGKYINTKFKFFLEIKASPECENELVLNFQGRPSKSYNLRHYHDHVFEWSMSYDEVKKRGMYTITDPEYYKIEFEIYPDNRASKIIWHLEDLSRPEGLVFDWKDEKRAEAWQAVHRGMNALDE